MYSEGGQAIHEFILSELVDLFEEGEKRYKYLIPPGYIDSKKDEEDITKRRKFGDLIVWKEMLQHISNKGKDLIFVTNDVKEDWWELEITKDPIEARKELQKEFKEVTGQEFIMTTAGNFFNYVAKVNNIDNGMAYLELNKQEVI